MDNIQNKDFFTKNVYFQDGKVYRIVDNISEYEKIIEILKQNNLFNEKIVGTRVYSKPKNILEHEFISGIVHSEEYTESMAYDIAQIGIDMAIKLLKYGIYSLDLLPHNFSFVKGEWILIDYEALSLSAKTIKAIIRGFFKILFSSFEITKIVPRKDLKHCYLNRIKINDLRKIIPFREWFIYFIRLNFAILLIDFKLYNFAYLYIKKILKTYSDKFKKNTFNSETNDNEQNMYNYINSLVSENQPKNIMAIGISASKWAVNSYVNNSVKFIFADDYTIADEIYNTIRLNKIKNTSIAQLCPLTKENEIPVNYKYRALYDSYTKKRFPYECAIFIDEIPLEQNLNEFLDNLSSYASKILIINSMNFPKEKFDKLSKLYKEVKFIDNNKLIVCYERIYDSSGSMENKRYENYNRGKNAKLQTQEITDIIQNYKKVIKNF